LASIGGGPRFVHAGRFPLYPEAELDDWARSRISPLKASTTDHGVGEVDENLPAELSLAPSPTRPGSTPLPGETPWHQIPGRGRSQQKLRISTSHGANHGSVGGAPLAASPAETLCVIEERN
jgi:hypothetical protein